MRRGWRALLAALLLAAPPARAVPGRVVSLNLCTDALLVLLAPGRIAALSPLARDPALSVVARQAAALPVVRPDAEAVLALHPDLVLAGAFGAGAAVQALGRQHARVVQFAQPTDFAGIDRQVTRIAALLGASARGAALLASMHRTLAAVARRDRGSAVFWEAHGYAAGPFSFEAAVLRAAGWRNRGEGRVVDVEAMAARPPDLLVTESAPAFPSLATDMLRHPALVRIRRVDVPPALLACPGPWSARAVAMLAAAGGAPPGPLP